jgi:hypothetical protein
VLKTLLLATLLVVTLVRVRQWLARKARELPPDR